MQKLTHPRRSTAQPAAMTAADFQERVWLAVHSIPKGMVASYGQIALWAGKPRAARQVGRILGNLPDNTRLPWHRVVNSKGCISVSGPSAEEQRQRLLAEGVSIRGLQIAPQHRLA